MLLHRIRETLFSNLVDTTERYSSPEHRIWSEDRMCTSALGAVSEIEMLRNTRYDSKYAPQLLIKPNIDSV